MTSQNVFSVFLRGVPKLAESKYDRLHDKFWSCSTTKSGTRYERLAAFVLKSLEQSNIVVHDIKLTGDADVPHQIDVSIQESDRQKRVLIECKDFDISGQKVGLPVVTHFFGVVQDVHPDEAIIITCNGFTKDARKFAKNKGIKLAVLREFVYSDWGKIIREIHLSIEVQDITQPKVEFLFFNDDDQNRFIDAVRCIGGIGSGLWARQPIHLRFPNGRIHLHQFVKAMANRHPRNDPGPVSLKIRFGDTAFEIGDQYIPIQAIHINFEVLHYENLLKITSDRIARLILEGFGDRDFVICDDDLVKYDIDETTGEIIPQSSTAPCL